MQIHKAWYGPKGGHALLASTDPGLQSVFRQAAWLTDLPGTVPTGLEWHPYFRAAIHEDFYVLIHVRSSRDTTRAGMVDSVAAFVPLAELPLVPDMRELAQNLSDSLKRDDRTPFEPSAQAVSAPFCENSPVLVSIARALLASRSRPVVHVGQGGFDDVMLTLLQVVPRQLRREILFSLSFSPEDVGASIAVSVPTQLSSRFPQSAVIDPEDGLPSAGVAALLNQQEGQALLQFADAAAFDLQSMNSLILLEEAFRLWNSNSSVGDAISLVRLLAAKTGEVARATEIRQTALVRLTSASEQWTSLDVLSMRNLDLERFQSDLFTSTVRDWSRKQANQGAPTEQDCRLLEQAARRAGKHHWWNTYVLAGFTSALKTNSEGVCALAWMALEKLPDALEAVLEFFQTEGQLPSLAARAPAALPTTVADTVAQHCAKQGAWQLCAAALAAGYRPQAALTAVLKLGPPKTSRVIAIQTALSKASSADLLEIAIREDTAEVTSLAAAAVAKDVRLARGFSWISLVWFDILGKASATNGAVAAEVPNRLRGLEDLIARGEDSERAWAAILKAGLADLSQVPNRPRAWAIIPRHLSGSVAKSTAKGWVSGLLAGIVSVGPLEEPLRSEVRSLLREPDVMQTLADKSPTTLITVASEIYPQSDDECNELLDAFGRASGQRLSAIVAVAIGKQIRERSWTSSAARVASHAYRRDDFLPLCRECLGLMAWWDRFLLGRRMGQPVEIPVNEAWRMLEEELSNLYPQGPSDQEFWSRSGGKDEELRSDGNGLAQWHRCIKQVRSGGASSAAALLRTALKDYGGNPVLQVLRDSHALD